MNENELQNLLQQIDQTTSLPNLSDGLAQQVHQKVARRRQIKRRATTAIVLLLCVGMAGLLTLNFKQDVSKPEPVVAVDAKDSPTQIVALQTDMKQLEQQINERMAFLEKILAQQDQRNRLAELERKLAALGDPLAEVKQQVDDAALTIYYQANRKLTELNQPAAAAAQFQQVIQLFPDSTWAAKAQEQLKKLKGTSHRPFTPVAQTT